MKKLLLLFPLLFVFSFSANAGCVKTNTGFLEFTENVDGFTTAFQLYVECHQGFITYRQNINDLLGNDLHVYIFEIGMMEVPPSEYSVQQGIVSLNTAPHEGAHVYFELIAHSE